MRAQQAILQLQAEVEKLHHTTSDIIEENKQRTRQIEVNCQLSNEDLWPPDKILSFKLEVCLNAMSPWHWYLMYTHWIKKNNHFPNICMLYIIEKNQVYKMPENLISINYNNHLFSLDRSYIIIGKMLQLQCSVFNEIFLMKNCGLNVSFRGG